MQGGQQEDAEEFLGFYLDTLEEELLTIVNSLSATPGSTKLPPGNKPAPVEEKFEMQEEEEGWLEVGRRNKMVVTRTASAHQICSPFLYWRLFAFHFSSFIFRGRRTD